MLQTEIDLRCLLPEVRDQGKRATCLSFAVTSAHELSRSAGSAVAADLCEEVLHWACKQIDQDNLPTTTLRSARIALRDTGQPSEHLWPYDDNRDELSASYLPPAGALDKAACHRAKLISAPRLIPNLKDHLVEGRAVIVAIATSYDFPLTTTGIIPMPQANVNLADYHAILLVGFSNTLHGGVFIFRNSWGKAWGDNGYGYLPYNYVKRYAVSAMTIE